MEERTRPQPASDDARREEREALRARLAEAVARHDAYPVAQRTLVLLMEAVVETVPEAPGYRVVDRMGAPRLRAEDGLAPMSLDDLMAELRGRHPALFRPPAPVPEPVPLAEPPAATEDFKVATARFLGAQTMLARTVAARSALRGRAFAASLSGAWAGLTTRRASTPPEAPGEAAPAPPTRPSPIGEAVRGMAGHARGRFADTTSRLREGMRDRNAMRDVFGRRGLILGFGAVAVALVAAMWAGQGADEEAASPSVQTEAQAPAAGGAGAPDTSPAPLDEPPAPDRRPDELTGPAEVIDTATLRVAGKLVRLFGVEWVRGGQADELTRYLAGRPVTCRPVAGSEARLCAVEGRDLSEVVLFNGGGRASSEATPDLVAAEDRARSERLGVWAR